jgi:hypothetical protein
MPLFNFPHIFKDGVNETASGAQVMEDLEVLKKEVEGLQAGSGNPGARTEHAMNTYTVASATRRMIVTIDVELQPAPGFGAVAKVLVSGVLVAELFAGEPGAGGLRQSVSFPVNAGHEWKVEAPVGHAASLHASYS